MFKYNKIQNPHFLHFLNFQSLTVLIIYYLYILLTYFTDLFLVKIKSKASSTIIKVRSEANEFLVIMIRER